MTRKFQFENLEDLWNWNNCKSEDFVLSRDRWMWDKIYENLDHIALLLFIRVLIYKYLKNENLSVSFFSRDHKSFPLLHKRKENFRGISARICKNLKHLNLLRSFTYCSTARDHDSSPSLHKRKKTFREIRLWVYKNLKHMINLYPR